MTIRIDGELIESTAGQVAAELERRGIDPARRVFITLEPDDWLSRGRREIRQRVAAAGLSDEDVDRLVKEARREANEKVLPFEPLVPNEQTIAAMRETRRGGLPTFGSIEDLMYDLDAEVLPRPATAEP